MFTKEQLAQIIKEETAAVLAEQETNEALTGGLTGLGGKFKEIAGGFKQAYQVGSVKQDIKKQIDTIMKQNAATLAALQKLDARAEQLGVPDEKLKTAIQYGQYLANILQAEASELEKAKPVTGAADGAGGEPTIPKE